MEPNKIPDKAIPTYEEAEVERIDGLMEQLREEKRKLHEDMKEKPQKLEPTEITKVGEVAFARIVFGMLGGQQKEFDVRVTAGGYNNVWIEFHGCWRLSCDEMRMLENVVSYGGGPEDKEPSFDVDVYACTEHIDCLVVEFDVWFSDNDWKKLTERQCFQSRYPKRDLGEASRAAERK